MGLPLSVDPLIAEAKQRARRRALAIALGVLAVAGAGALAAVALAPSAQTGTQGSHPLTARVFVNPGGEMGGGRPLLGIGRSTNLFLIPSAPFHIGISLQNRTSQSVTLTDVRAVLPNDSVVRQLGTALAAPSQVLGIGCGISERSSYGPLTPSPLSVAPGKYGCVQLNFQFLGCPAASSASIAAVSLLNVSYTTPTGAIGHQRVGLGTSRFQIHTPLSRCGSVPVSPTGSIGPVSVGSSTSAEVLRVFGPGYAGGSGRYPLGGARFGAIGYGCKGSAATTTTGIPRCDTVFYFHHRSGVVALIYTRSSRFTYRGVHPGTSSTTAARILGKATSVGCYTGYRLPTKTGTLFLARQASQIGFMAIVGANDNLHVLGCIDRSS